MLNKAYTGGFILESLDNKPRNARFTIAANTVFIRSETSLEDAASIIQPIRFLDCFDLRDTVGLLHLSWRVDRLLGRNSE